MDDLISRRDAIDAVENIDCSDGVGISALKCEAVDDGVTAIKALPSAQPEIIRCKDCLHFFDNLFRCDKVTWYNGKDDFCSKAKRREK